MNEIIALIKKYVTEYPPGEYCKTIGCKFYREGRFGEECNGCLAYVFYLWLQEQGYKIVLYPRGDDA